MIWPLEVANALNVAERHKRLRPADIARFVELIHALPISLDVASFERATGAILDIAREQKLSSYDAAYLELAMREGLPLSTGDKALAAAAGRLGVQLGLGPEC